MIGIGLLWLSAILTLYTGWDYFRAGVRHLTMRLPIVQRRASKR